MALKRIGKKEPIKKPLIKKVKKVESNNENLDISYDSLNKIIDHSRDFSIFYSGVENYSYLKGCYDMGVRNFLMSFHYLQNKHINMEKTYGNLGIKFFISTLLPKI